VSTGPTQPATDMHSERPAPTTSAGAPAAAPLDKRIASALTRYRTLAIATGLWLLVLTTEMVFKYIVQVDPMPAWTDYIAIVHGWVYFIYLLVTIDLAVKARWRPGPTVGVLLAGTIPFLSFYVEHKVTRKVRAGQRL
jgi:integral membrane protein